MEPIGTRCHRVDRCDWCYRWQRYLSGTNIQYWHQSWNQFLLWCYSSDDLDGHSPAVLIDSIISIQLQLIVDDKQWRLGIITEHADPVEIVQVATNVVPTPIAASVKNDAVLFTIVIIGLFPTPRWSLDLFTGQPTPRARCEWRIFLGSDPHHRRLEWSQIPSVNNHFFNGINCLLILKQVSWLSSFLQSSWKQPTTFRNQPLRWPTWITSWQTLLYQIEKHCIKYSQIRHAVISFSFLFFFLAVKCKDL